MKNRLKWGALAPVAAAALVLLLAACNDTYVGYHLVSYTNGNYTVWTDIYTCDQAISEDVPVVAISGTFTNQGDVNWYTALWQILNQASGRFDNYAWEYGSGVSATAQGDYAITDASGGSVDFSWDTYLAMAQAGVEYTVTFTYVSSTQVNVAVEFTVTGSGTYYGYGYTNSYVVTTSGETSYSVQITGEGCDWTVDNYYAYDSDGDLVAIGM